MKYLPILPFICMACLSVWLVMRPSTAQMLAKEIPPISRSLDILMPTVGTPIHLPYKDIFGRPIGNIDGRVVVSMPSCQGCTKNHLNWETLRNLSPLPVVLVFNETPGKDFPQIQSQRFRILVEGKVPVLPVRLHDFGPNCVWLNKSGRVVRSQSTFALDGANKAKVKA